jgi:hypothetical protein
LQSESRSASRHHAARAKAAHPTTTWREAAASHSHTTYAHAAHTHGAHGTSHAHSAHTGPHSHCARASHPAHAAHALSAHSPAFGEAAPLGLHFANPDSLRIGEHAERRRPGSRVVAHDLLAQRRERIESGTQRCAILRRQIAAATEYRVAPGAHPLGNRTVLLQERALNRIERSNLSRREIEGAPHIYQRSDRIGTDRITAPPARSLGVRQRRQNRRNQHRGAANGTSREGTHSHAHPGK